MDDISEAIISHLRLDDAPSLFHLQVVGLDYAHPAYTFHNKQFCPVLKVTAPVEAGRRVFTVDYLDNHRRTEMNNRSQYERGWEKITFHKDDWEGAVAFVDGFMNEGGRASRITLHRLDSRQSLASWDTEARSDEMRAARLAIIRGAFKALLAK
ncbi:hypothetical protein AB1Y20_015888 [Prymnesium parvum]|uniref:Uncharacterized protein n=1 Tax=Prymnesium parvum TaxID=97485 RepID=A0AB34JZS3_PRYPA|mmetsp:Transcript_48039/g.118920  ORF Transcript_48039/g.118920 Transcript_48039/m.118920 type:complete len:154 (-) Transcript_48039:399-860(-)